jgi:threonine/homoserine/homoserine lactone efflux protein
VSSALATLIAQFLDPGKGPEQSGDFRVSPTFFIVLVLAGFVVGTLGHVVKSKTVVAMGVTMIFLGTVLLPLGLSIAR